MLLSLSYDLLQALSSLVLHAKPLVVTLDLTCLSQWQKTTLWKVRRSSGSKWSLPLKGSPLPKSLRLDQMPWSCVSLWHIEGTKKAPATIPVSNKGKETNPIGQTSLHSQWLVDQDHLEQRWGVLLHQQDPQETTWLWWNWQWRKWRTNSRPAN